MRILNISQAYHPFLDRGGPAIKVRSIARSLVQLGHEVMVLTADLGFQPLQIAEAAATPDPQGWRSDLDNIETLYLTTRSRYRNLTVNPGVIPFCRERLRQFEVVHVYGLYDTLGPAVAHYCRQYGIPYLVEPLGMTRPIDRGFFLKKLWKRLTNGYLQRAATIITTSELERAELLAEGFPAEQLMLRYNGIDLGDFQQLPSPGSFRHHAGFAENDRIILFMGRLIPRKGADLLLEALAQLRNPNLKLVLAGPEGEAGYLDFLRHQARDLGVDQQVLFPGPLYGEQKKAALVDAFLFALPSRYENFGNSAGEAIACGTPAIVSDQCGIAPLIDRRAGLVTAYDANALTQGLQQLLNDADHYRRLKRGCPQVADELSWSKLIRDMEDAYARVVSAAPIRVNPSPATHPVNA